MAVAYLLFVLLCVLFRGEALQCVQDGKILPAPSGFTSLSGSESSGTQWEPLWVQPTLEASVWDWKWDF